MNELRRTKKAMIEALNKQIEEYHTIRQGLVDTWVKRLLPDWAQNMSTGTQISMLRDIEDEKHPDGLHEALYEMSMLLEEDFRLMDLRRELMKDEDYRRNLRF